MQKKLVFLFLALLLPVGIFLFLKIFGKNEFEVAPLFVDTAPSGDCPAVQLPYRIADSVWAVLPAEGLELLLIGVGDLSREASNEMGRVRLEWQSLPVAYVQLPPEPRYIQWARCVFYLEAPMDLVLIDRERYIRGQYAAGQRKDVDRLLTEVDIILKKY